MGGVIQFLLQLVEPKSQNEDVKRREFILNVILFGSIILLTIASLVLLYRSLILGEAYKGLPLIVPFGALLISAILYIVSRKGFSVIVSYILIGIYFIPTTYTIYAWGADLPQALLTYALIIVMAGMLISTRFAFIVTLIAALFLIIFTYFQINLIIHPKLYWKNELLEMGDSIVSVVTLGVIALISWLSNREIEKSLKRARKSEAELKKERDSLEIKVEERTKELKKAQLEKTMHLYRFAEFGRMTSGLFHDMVNPLTAASLNLENLKRYTPIQATTEAVPRLERALHNIGRVSDLIHGARKQIQKQEIKTLFSPAEEIALALQLLSFKARGAGVDLEFVPPEIIIKTFGNPIKFYRVITGLVANAIDAYDAMPKETEHKVLVMLRKEENNIIKLAVQDWGCGISTDNIDKIFEPLFTTKNYKKGTGIGLTIVKQIIEKEFDGRIKVQSKQGVGALFIVVFPLREKL